MGDIWTIFEHYSIVLSKLSRYYPHILKRFSKIKCTHCPDIIQNNGYTLLEYYIDIFLILYKYCRNIIRILSKHHPDIVQILSKYCAEHWPYIVQVLYKNGPDVLQILSKYCPIIFQIWPKYYPNII